MTEKILREFADASPEPPGVWGGPTFSVSSDTKGSLTIMGAAPPNPWGWTSTTRGTMIIQAG